MYVVNLVKPKINISTLNNVTIKAGRSHKWSVDVTGEPAPTIKWVFQNNTLSTNDRIKIDNIDYHSDINITNSVRKDTGKYVIIAENASGKDEAFADLTVLCK